MDHGQESNGIVDIAQANQGDGGPGSRAAKVIRRDGFVNDERRGDRRNPATAGAEGGVLSLHVRGAHPPPLLSITPDHQHLTTCISPADPPARGAG